MLDKDALSTTLSHSGAMFYKEIIGRLTLAVSLDIELYLDMLIVVKYILIHYFIKMIVVWR